MLHFEKETDIIFTAILDEAFKLMISEFNNDTDSYTEDELKGGILQYYMAHAKRNFTVETILPVLRDLAKYNREPGLWEINDYHYVVIYDTLRYYCDIQNDLAKERGEPILLVNDYRVESLDFDEIVEFYFPDIDFLWPEDTLLNLNYNQKKQLGARKELFGVITGLKPHPDELEIKLFEKGEFQPQDPDPLYFNKDSGCYLEFNVKKYEEDHQNDIL